MRFRQENSRKEHIKNDRIYFQTLCYLNTCFRLYRTIPTSRNLAHGYPYRRLVYIHIMYEFSFGGVGKYDLLGERL